MWYQREISQKVEAAARTFPALVVTGARQTGKTSLLRTLFPNLQLITLDIPSLAEEAERRPAELLHRNPPPLIIDEVQYAPSLFRHLKVEIDRLEKPVYFC